MSEIYNIIDKKKLDVVKKPISKAHGLPNECYTSREYTFIERKKLFEDKWVVVGTASSLPNSGDIKPFDLLGIPLLLVCLLYTSPSPRDGLLSRMPSSA